MTVVKVCALQLHRFSGRVEEFANGLPAQEEKRAGRYLHRADRERFVIGRTLIRRVCAIHAGIEPRAVVLRETEFGKPYFVRGESESRPALEFSLSHSGDCVLLAWTLGGPVGADVETIPADRQNRFHNIANSVFSPQECAVLSSAKAEQQAATFLRIWVRKEAVLKAEGCGVGGATGSFSVALPESSGIRWPEEIVFPGSARTWKVFDLELPTGHVGSLAAPANATLSDERGFLR